MKTRSGFVSNSSSSSFILMGCSLGWGKNPAIQEVVSEYLDIAEDSRIIVEIGSRRLNVQLLADDDGFYTVGVTPWAMLGSETLDQFKEVVLEAIKLGCPKLELEGKQLDWISGSYYS